MKKIKEFLVNVGTALEKFWKGLMRVLKEDLLQEINDVLRYVVKLIMPVSVLMIIADIFIKTKFDIVGKAVAVTSKVGVDASILKWVAIVALIIVGMSYFQKKIGK